MKKLKNTQRKYSRKWPRYWPTKKETPVITRLQGFFIVELVGFEPTS